MFEAKRIPSFAAASSIYACANVLFSQKNAELLKPRLLPNYEISMGGRLVFSDRQFLCLLENGLGIPKLRGILISPYQSLQVISYLWRVGRLYKSNNRKDQASLLMGASLTAICTYMNMHGKACRIFKNEKEHTLLINILNTETKYFISYDLEKGGTVKNTNKEVHASANLIFKNEDTARKAALGQLDFWIASASGDIVLAGLIPMLDKFGYVARIAQREIPLPR